MNNNMLNRVQTLRCYMYAMKDGDIETVATLLKEAEQDRTLENMFLEVHASSQNMDSTRIQKNDILQAQRLISKITHQTTRRDTMQRSFFSTEDDSAQSPTIATTQQPRSTDQLHPGRNTLLPTFPARTTPKRAWYRSPKGWIAALAAAILISLVLLQSNGVLASEILSLLHQIRPVIKDWPVDNRPYVAYTDLGSFSQPSGVFAHGPSPASSNLTKAQLMHEITFPLMLPGQLPGDLRNAKPIFGLNEGGYETFTFSSAKTHAYLVNKGYGNIAIPAKLDGATFRIGRGNEADIFYEGAHSDLLVTAGPIYDVRATGNASVKDLDDFLLLLPNLSPLAREQATHGNGDRLDFFPTGSQITSVTVHHVSGFLVSDKSRTMVLFWEENGVQYSLTAESAMNASQMLAIANSFHL